MNINFKLTHSYTHKDGHSIHKSKGHAIIDGVGIILTITYYPPLTPTLQIQQRPHHLITKNNIAHDTIKQLQDPIHPISTWDTFILLAINILNHPDLPKYLPNHIINELKRHLSYNL